MYLTALYETDYLSPDAWVRGCTFWVCHDTLTCLLHIHCTCRYMRTVYMRCRGMITPVPAELNFVYLYMYIHVYTYTCTCTVFPCPFQLLPLDNQLAITWQYRLPQYTCTYVPPFHACLIQECKIIHIKVSVLCHSRHSVTVWPWSCNLPLIDCFDLGCYLCQLSWSRLPGICEDC